MALCPTSECAIQLPDDNLVQINFTDAPQLFDRNCVRNVIFLVDDAGEEDIDDPGTPFLSVANRIFSPLSINSVTDHWDKDSEVYKFAIVFFGASEPTGRLKIGYVDRDPGAETLADGLIEIADCDNCWHVVTHAQLHSDGVTPYHDSVEVDELAAYVQAEELVLLTDSRDVLNQDANDIVHLKARLELLGYFRTVAFYHEGKCVNIDLDLETSETVYNYASALSAAVMSGRDFRSPNNATAYTIKYTTGAGLFPSQLPLETVRIVTGWLGPDVGLDADANGFANMYVNQSSRNMIVEGVTVTGRFIDSIHYGDFLRAEIQQGIVDYLASKRPYTNDSGIEIEGIIHQKMREGQQSGHITTDIDSIDAPDGSQKNGYYVVENPATGQSDLNRSQRLYKNFQSCFVESGAIHGVTVDLCREI